MQLDVEVFVWQHQLQASRMGTLPNKFLLFIHSLR